MTPKEIVATRFLEFISRFVPLPQARLATLGGNGVEAKLWEKAGIAPHHAWLIELHRKRKGALIRTYRYQHHDRLSTFFQIMSGLSADSSSIDGFHLDLCGTLHKKMSADFAAAIPTVLNSTGKCIAVTVVDQRRNMTLEEWPDALLRVQHMFGTRAESLYHTLAHQQQHLPVTAGMPGLVQPFDPVKSAKREVGVIAAIMQILHAAAWSVDVMERYVYVNRYQRHPFRMRTYFLHLSPSTSNDTDNRSLQRWVDSPILWFAEHQFVDIHVPATTAKHTTPKRTFGMTGMTKLEELARLLGGDILAEYQRLSADSAKLARFKELMEGSEPTETIVDEVPVTMGTAKAHTPRKVWTDLTDEEQLHWLIGTMELRTKLGKGWSDDEWKKLLKKDFGHWNAALGKSLRSALARTNGKFRPTFEKRIVRVFPENAQQYLDRLALLPLSAR